MILRLIVRVGYKKGLFYIAWLVLRVEFYLSENSTQYLYDMENC